VPALPDHQPAEGYLLHDLRPLALRGRCGDAGGDGQGRAREPGVGEEVVELAD